MRKFYLACALTAAAASLADAGPFHRRGRVTAAVCTTGTCQQAATQTQQPKPAQPVAAQGNTATAQGVAILIVQTGRFRHWGGNSGYEGIGMGPTPAAAEAACCFRNRMVPRDRGFAQMANGTWVCVCRY